jgi:NADH-quinone oxidoreductase subunit H
VIKVFILLFGYIWLRGTLPRIRYDQLMAIGWKVLIPVSIVWILLIATVRAWRLDSHSTAPYVVFGFVIVLILILAWAWDNAAQQRAMRYSAPEADPSDLAEASAEASAFPVPPMDLPHYHGIGLEAGVGIEAGPSPSGTSPKEVTGA